MDTYFKCDYCNINEKKFEYSSYVMRWYCNRSYSKYFCSKKCLDNYENEWVWHLRHYSKDLKKPESDIYVSCTKYPYNSSLWQLYEK